MSPETVDNGIIMTAKSYKTVTKVAGPLIFLKVDSPVAYGEFVEITLPDGELRKGKVLETHEDLNVILVFEGTSGIDTKETAVRHTGDVIRLPVSTGLLGRVFNGIGAPRDGGPKIIPDDHVEINGETINPFRRVKPKEFMQTGISAIDGMIPLVRGQKLPIFSGSGLPHNELAVQLARQAKVLGGKGRDDFAVVFGAMGITNDDAAFFTESFEKSGAIERSVLFLNLADEPAIERLTTPKMALTAAEFLAFKCGMHVLVILTDMTNYCETLRQVAAAREEVPGRRGYPGYMYTDLATIYERAGVVGELKGSITLIPILTLPGDDITHPIPDLTGYVTEGQVTISRELHNRGLYPPIDVLKSLSRLGSGGIGSGKTREDHKDLVNQLFAFYAEGVEVRNLSSIVGEESLGDYERKLLEFAKRFEDEFLRQGPGENRSIDATLGLCWKLLGPMPESELKRIRPEFLKKYYVPEQKSRADSGEL